MTGGEGEGGGYGRGEGGVVLRFAAACLAVSEDSCVVTVGGEEH